MAALGNFCRNSICYKFQFQVPTSRKSEKIQPQSSQLLKLKQQKCLYFFGFLTLWYLKLRFVSNTFRTKISKSSHCDNTKITLYGLKTLQVNSLTLLNRRQSPFFEEEVDDKVCKVRPQQLHLDQDCVAHHMVSRISNSKFKI